MHTRTRSRILHTVFLSTFGVLAACSSSGDPSTGTSSGEALVTLPGGAPRWASSANFQARVDQGEVVSLQVHLPMRNLADAKAALERVSNPDDPSFGKFLGDDEFAAKYGPTDADVAAVRAHFESHGMRVTEVPDNKAYVTVEGTAAQVERVFNTTLGSYHVHGEMLRAPMGAAKLPASVSQHVSGVVGLAQHKMRPMILRPGSFRKPGGARPSDVAPNTCSEYYGQIVDTTDPALTGFPTLPYANCGYKPAQLRNAYGFEPMVRKGNDGTGEKIAIVDAFTSPTLVQDATTYFANQDADYPLDAKQITLLVGPGTPGTVDTGWYGEQSLDVESMHAIAPGAHIVYVGAASAFDKDLIAAVNLIVSKHAASAISNSYGSDEDASYGSNTAWQSMAIQAGLKGIGLYFASGDAGDGAFDLNNPLFGTPSPNFPASLAEVTAVGGTTLGLGADGSKLFELGWEDGYDILTPATLADGGTDPNPADSTWQPGGAGAFAYGGGGGWSQLYFEPTYQKGVVPASLAADPNTGVAERVLPDVSMLGDPTTGFIIGMTDPNSGTYGESDIGGTSLSTPMFTATVALAQQNAKRTFGFANPLFYKASKSGAFTDVAPAARPYAAALPANPAQGAAAAVLTLDYRGHADNTISTAVGFDTVTGLGTPNAAKFFAHVK